MCIRKLKKMYHKCEADKPDLLNVVNVKLNFLFMFIGIDLSIIKLFNYIPI